MNNSKTKFLSVSRKNCKLNKIEEFNMAGEIVKVDKSVNYLGFILDNNLTMDKQINRVCAAGYGMLRSLWKISNKVTNRKLRTQLVHSAILSRVNYCSSLYTGLPKKQTYKSAH